MYILLYDEERGQLVTVTEEFAVDWMTRTAWDDIFFFVNIEEL